MGINGGYFPATCRVCLSLYLFLCLYVACVGVSICVGMCNEREIADDLSELIPLNVR